MNDQSERVAEIPGLAPVPSTPGEIIKARLELDRWIKSEMARLDEYYKPFKAWLQKCDDKLLELMIEQKVSSFSTDHGTAYKSTIQSFRIEDRTKFLDFALEQWDAFGNEALMFSAQKDACKQYMEAHNGELPPGLSTSAFTRVNIRKS